MASVDTKGLASLSFAFKGSMPKSFLSEMKNELMLSLALTGNSGYGVVEQAQ